MRTISTVVFSHLLERGFTNSSDGCENIFVFLQAMTFEDSPPCSGCPRTPRSLWATRAGGSSPTSSSTLPRRQPRSSRDGTGRARRRSRSCRRPTDGILQAAGWQQLPWGQRTAVYKRTALAGGSLTAFSRRLADDSCPADGSCRRLADGSCRRLADSNCQAVSGRQLQAAGWRHDCGLFSPVACRVLTPVPRG